MNLDTAHEICRGVVDDWLDSRRRGDRPPSRNVVAAGLALLEILRDVYPLTQADYVTHGTQIKEIKRLVAIALRRHGEDRIYSSESGRTSRSTLAHAVALAERLNEVEAIAELIPADRRTLAERLQAPLAAHITEFLDRQGMQIEIPDDVTIAHAIANILELAGDLDATGPVAQHLVAASLALRFPNAPIPNHSATTADALLKRAGDIEIGDAVFHVTLAPSEGLLLKCRENVRRRLRPTVLVPLSKVDFARNLADNIDMTNRVGVYSIEQFIGQNVDEIGSFTRETTLNAFRELIDLYNARVAIEKNSSLRIEIASR